MGVKAPLQNRPEGKKQMRAKAIPYEMVVNYCFIPSFLSKGQRAIECWRVNWAGHLNKNAFYFK
jgi:hypothetical protein